MNTPILNRDFQHPSDGWYHIEAKGNHPNLRAGIIQVIDNKACQAIADAFNAEAAKPDFAGMLIDHEHFKHDADKETVAYGWLTQLQNRDDGLHGQIRWTGTGKEAVDGGDYRFFSTEYAPKDVTVLNRGESPQRVRPTRLDGLTLTNANNNKGQRPITNRGSDTGPLPKEIKMKRVCTTLGLSEDASEESVLSAVTTLLNRATTAESKIAPLETKVKEQEAIQIDADLETYKNRFDPKQRDFVKGMLVTNRASTIDFLKAQAEIKTPLAPGKIHNRSTAGAPEADASGETADEVELSAQRNEAINDYKITNRCSFQQAHDAVRRKQPKLFGLAKK